MSLCVHALLSLQAVPLVLFTEQVPVLGLHVLHWFVPVQGTGFDPVHVPLWHVSLCVHALLSLQAVPFDTAVLTQYREPLKML